MRILAIMALSGALTQGMAPNAQAPRTWGYTPPSAGTGGEGRLAYGVDGTDDVDAILDCRPGEGRMRISSWVDAKPTDRGVTLASGRTRSRRLSTFAPNDIAEGYLVVTPAPASDPVLRAFRRGGGLSIITKAGRTDLPPAPSELTERAFRDCLGAG